MEKEKVKKLSKTKKIILIVFALFLLLCIGLMAFLHSKLNRINRIDASDVEMVSPEEETFDGLTKEEAGEDTEDVFWNNVDMDIMRDENVHNILLIGQDRRDGEGRQR